MRKSCYAWATHESGMLMVMDAMLSENIKIVSVSKHQDIHGIDPHKNFHIFGIADDAEQIKRAYNLIDTMDSCGYN